MSGIYKLTIGQDTYIGKSVDIPRRTLEHRKKLFSGTASKRMQAAFDKVQSFSIVTILECHADHIDVMETLMIVRHQPTLNSASTLTISSRDLEVYSKLDLGYLKLSTADLANLLDASLTFSEDLKKQNSALQVIRTEEELATQLGQQLVHARKRLKDTVDEMQLTSKESTDKIIKLLSRNLWQRIWNYG